MSKSGESSGSGSEETCAEIRSAEPVESRVESSADYAEHDALLNFHQTPAARKGERISCEINLLWRETGSGGLTQSSSGGLM